MKSLVWKSGDRSIFTLSRASNGQESTRSTGKSSKIVEEVSDPLHGISIETLQKGLCHWRLKRLTYVCNEPSGDDNLREEI